MGFPDLPGILPPGTPTGLINPVLRYDWGNTFNYQDATGYQSIVPPNVDQVMNMKVPRVDADGNEIGGVPIVLRDAPLGTYMGWNITSVGFHQGQICGYQGGMIPFANTQAQRLAANDPRLSLEERYGSHNAYVAAVQRRRGQRGRRRLPAPGRPRQSDRPGDGGQRLYLWRYPAKLRPRSEIGEIPEAT